MPLIEIIISRTRQHISLMLEAGDTYMFGHCNPKPVQEKGDQFIITLAAQYIGD